MPSRAKGLFDTHISECLESITIHEHLEIHSGYKADFSLRYVWIAAVSALDQYISFLILEKATEAFAGGSQLQNKLMSDTVSFASAIELRSADPIRSILVFRSIVAECIRYKSFQHPDKISDGLSYIWDEKHKWQILSRAIGLSVDTAKGRLSAIVDRRNLIAHSADFDEARSAKLGVNRQDATEVMNYVAALVGAIETVAA